MEQFTLDQIMKLKPCHKREELILYMKGKGTISLTEILESEAINPDKIWLVVRLIPVPQALEFAQWCADRVKHLDNFYSRRAAAYAAYAADRDSDAAAYAASTADAAASAADADAAAYVASTADAARKEIRLNQVNKLKEMVG